MCSFCGLVQRETNDFEMLPGSFKRRNYSGVPLGKFKILPTHKYGKHKWNVYQYFLMLFIHKNTNQGPYSHILVEYMVSNKAACTMEMHDSFALSGKEIPSKFLCQALRRLTSAVEIHRENSKR